MRLLATAAAALSLCGTAAAGTVTLDFEEASAGDFITTQYGGVAVSANGFGAMVFDSGNVTGGDTDLGAPFTDANGITLDPGNILIVSEDGDASDPDDRGAGGVIALAFDRAVTFDGFDVFDIDRAEGFTASFFGADGARLAELTNTSVIGDNGFARFAELYLFGVVRAEFAFTGSGAIDRLTFTEADAVPVPAAGLLFTTGAGGLFARRRLARRA